MDYPCLTCQTQVRGRQQAVECDWCHRWQHRKCGTGISQSAYREAVKLGGLSFVCRPCRDSEIAPPTLELSVIEQNPRDTSLEEPPILEISIPVTRNKGDKFTEDTVIDDIHEQVPTENTTWPDVPLDLRIPETQIDEDDDTNMYFEDTVIDDMQMHEIREEIPDILAEWEPSADSTNIERPDEVSSFDLSLGHTVNDSSFDISAHEIEPVLPIEERTMNDVLSETILQDRGTTFTIIESGSQKRSKVLVSSLGFAYGMKRENKSSTIWRCTSRSKNVNCPAEIRQSGDVFHQKHDHLHPSVSDRELKLKVYSKVRQTACEQVFRPATALAEEIILDFYRPDNVAGLKKGLLKRSANRARAALRPKEPKTLDFEQGNPSHRRIYGDPYPNMCCLEKFIHWDIFLGIVRRFLNCIGCKEGWAWASYLLRCIISMEVHYLLAWYVYYEHLHHSLVYILGFSIFHFATVIIVFIFGILVLWNPGELNDKLRFFLVYKILNVVMDVLLFIGMVHAIFKLNWIIFPLDIPQLIITIVVGLDLSLDVMEILMVGIHCCCN